MTKREKKRLEKVKSQLIEYALLKKKKHEIEAKMTKIKKWIIKRMKSLDIDKIEVEKGFGQLRVTLYRQAFFLSKKARDEIEQYADTLDIHLEELLLTIPMRQLDMNTLIELHDSDQISDEAFQKLKSLGRSDVLKIIES